jgi:mevalonate kinase
MRVPSFFAKILLFGEYGIIYNSKGLSIPYKFYYGALKIPKTKSNFSDDSHKKLLYFSEYLKKLDKDLISFNWEKFNFDLERKIYFESSIPQGYGVGSSAALVSAIYDKYSLSKILFDKNLDKKRMLQLKNIFSLMESFFHGKSSGLDPLNSYLKQPILINSKDNIQTINIPSQNDYGKGAIFLVDSGEIGKTAPMISLFMENMKNEAFNNLIIERFIRYSDACIENFINGNINLLFTNIKSLSKFVLKNLKPMIPNTFHQLWKTGIDSETYYLKLCGSGGGGFILGFTEDFEKAQKKLKDYPLKLVYLF